MTTYVEIKYKTIESRRFRSGLKMKSVLDTKFLWATNPSTEGYFYDTVIHVVDST